MKFWSLILVAMLAVASMDADAARRMGGGQSVGRQSSNVTQRDGGASPAAPAAAPQQNAARQPGAAQTPPTPSRPWGGILGGLAAGLGLAWLASSLGFGAGFANFLMIALLVVVALAVFGAIRARRAAGAAPGHLRYQGAGGAPVDPVEPRQYNPAKIGNDASARPWERNSMAFDSAKYAPGGQGTQSGVRIGAGVAGGSGLDGPQSWGVPAGFDTEGFLAAAKRNFVTLQDAWDRADIATLRAMMTDEMLTEIRNQIAERDKAGTAAGRTEVAMLEAQLLGIEETVDDYLASVEFSGMIKEDPTAGPTPFREVWNMVKTKDGRSGWLVAGVQALQ